ncbi:MAG: sulfatase-like hydrolase/transferase [Acidobacteria bacterium]|nr:sulfatase-like hydrolase/transferase [Acidobacteriota bacterium]
MNIQRRDFLKTAGATALAPEASRPNLLIVMTDQQFAGSMSCRMGDRYLRTPNMDRLAANGMLFTRAYTANPLCVPARTSMFTGRYPAETGIETNDKVPFDPRKYPHMGSIFRGAGYATGYFGKWHMPYPEAGAELHGFSTVKRNKAAHDIGVAAEAAQFIRAKRDSPFLAVASFLNPHNICQWPRGEEFSEGDPGKPPPPGQCPPLRPNHGPQKDEPDIMTLMRRSYQATPMFPVSNYNVKQWREYIWAYYRMIEKVDGLVGQVLQAVRESGQEEHTLVAFLADHGDCQGAHGWNQKTAFYEESARVPLILSCKGTTRPGVSRRLANTGVDLIPTLCDYAGIPVPAGLPGLSLKDTANGKSDRDPREYTVVCNKMVQGAPIDGRRPMPDGRMVRGQRYKYCVYNEGRNRESLVDLDQDPGEMVNLAGDAAHAKILARHREMLAEWRGRIGAAREWV